MSGFGPTFAPPPEGEDVVDELEGSRPNLAAIRSEGNIRLPELLSLPASLPSGDGGRIIENSDPSR